MALLRKLGVTIGAVLLTLVLLLTFYRVFKEELLDIGCLLLDVPVCDTTEQEDGIKIAGLLHQIQEGIKQVQDLNATERSPHIFFVDGLTVELFFSVKKTGANSVDLVVLPFDADATSENTNTQKLILEFSTTTDEHIQSYISAGCQEGSLLSNDVRLAHFCKENVVATSSPSTGDEARNIDTSKLDLKFEELLRSHDFGSANSGSSSLEGTWSEPLADLCSQYNVCSDATVGSYSWDPVVGAVSGVNVQVDPERLKSIVDSAEGGQLSVEGWAVEQNQLGDGLLISPVDR